MGEYLASGNENDWLLRIVVEVAARVGWVRPPPKDQEGAWSLGVVRHVYRLATVWYTVGVFLFRFLYFKDVTALVCILSIISGSMVLCALRLGSSRALRAEELLSSLIFERVREHESRRATGSNMGNSAVDSVVYSSSQFYTPGENAEEVMQKLDDDLTNLETGDLELIDNTGEGEGSDVAMMDFFSDSGVGKESFNLRGIQISVSILMVIGSFSSAVYTFYDMIASGGDPVTVSNFFSQCTLVIVFAEFCFALFHVMAWIRLCQMSITTWSYRVVETIESIGGVKLANSMLPNAAQLLEAKIDVLHDIVALPLTVMNQQFSLVVSYVTGFLATGSMLYTLLVFQVGEIRYIEKTWISAFAFNMVFFLILILYISGVITESLLVARENFRRPSVLLALRRCFGGQGEDAMAFARAYFFHDSLSFKLLGVPFSHSTALGLAITLLLGIIFTFGPSVAERYIL